MSKRWLKRMYRETDWGARILSPLVRARDYWAEGRWRADRDFIVRQYERAFGVPPDLAQPRTLNEKLAWMKLHDRNPLQPIAADKHAVRAHVAARIGEGILVPLLATFASADEIDFARLPNAFVLKTNHGSGQNWIVRDKAREDSRRIVRQFREWMRLGHYATSREWPYKGMKPLILAEQLLLDEAGEIPSDYKFHCFAGKVETVQVDLDRETAHRRNFYDLDWQLQPFTWSEWADGKPSWPNGRTVERPDALPEMVRVAEALSADFPYARIDLFYCRKKIYFGEITFYHGGGRERFDPPETDRQFGDLLPLPRSDSP
jgi:hypothetical protein